MIYRRCPRCGSRIPSGTTCGCMKRDSREYDLYRRDKKSKGFYNSAEWQTARMEALQAAGGLDVWLYMTEGRAVAADTVHHIIPLKEDWSRRCDISNLLPLSHSSHSVIEQMYKESRKETQARLKRLWEEFRSTRGA